MLPTRHVWTNLGLQLAYHVWEPSPVSPSTGATSPEAPETPQTIVLLHGYLDHGRSFDPVAQVLARRFRVIAPDHRGHGESGFVGAGGYYHFPDYILDLHRLFDHLQIEQAMLAGHSMGASIACYFVGAFSERIKALALLDGIGPSHVPAERSPALIRRWINDLRLAQARGDGPNDTMESLDEVARRLARTSPGATPERLLELARTASLPAENGTYRWRFDPMHRTTSPMPFDLSRFRVFLQSIRCPTLAVWGERSPMRPPDAAERMALIQDLTYFELPGAAHNLHHERPDELAAVLFDFFAKAPKASS